MDKINERVATAMGQLMMQIVMLQAQVADLEQQLAAKSEAEKAV